MKNLKLFLILIVISFLYSDTVRKYCIECEDFKYAEQDTINTEWIPDGCDTHNFKDFVIIDSDEIVRDITVFPYEPFEIDDSTDVVLITETSLDGLLDSLQTLDAAPIDSVTKNNMLQGFIRRHIKKVK